MKTVGDDPDLRAQVVAQALKELEYWKMRYGQYSELFPVRIDRKRVRAGKAIAV